MQTMTTDFSAGLTFSTLFFALLNGILSFVSPCILPLIPSYVSYITGISYDELTDIESRKRNRSRTLSHALFFVGGFSLIFVLLGASASLVGGLLAQHLGGIRIAGGIFVVLMGIMVMDVVRIPFLQREAKLRLKARPAGYAGTFIVGLVFGAAWTPCTGPFLGAVLAMAMESTTIEKGIALLTFYSLGLGIPFIFSALAINVFLSSFNKFKNYLKAIKIGSGLVLILIGVLIIANKLTILMPR